ncbi:MAG: hypothetical protein MZW92_66450 [Comamonadaceae bacterium]|nr:hypothetical protein [Comamonadaceae bacterium]
MLIALLTNGRPDFLNTKVPAGTTDILRQLHLPHRVPGLGAELRARRGDLDDHLLPRRDAVAGQPEAGQGQARRRS